ncbi:hypothetical protein [Nonomuraea sp. B5E05]
MTALTARAPAITVAPAHARAVNLVVLDWNIHGESADIQAIAS